VPDVGRGIPLRRRKIEDIVCGGSQEQQEWFSMVTTSNSMSGVVVRESQKEL